MNRPHNGIVADCMRRSRALYHYGIRHIRKNEEAIIRDRIADVLLNDPRRSFWTEVSKIRNKQSAVSSVIDGCNDTDSIAQLFARKYKELYSSVPSDTRELSDIIHSIGNDVYRNGVSHDYIVTVPEVSDAIARLKPHKYDGCADLSSDHFLNAGSDLCIHIALMFSSITFHGCVP